MGETHDRRIPKTRGLEPQLRRNRIVAARKYAAGSIPRLAIMLGHWDAGDVVRLGGTPPKPKRRRRKVNA